MGDEHMKTLQAKPKLGLEELYQGIPDESVNLTFQDLPNVISSHHTNTTMPTTTSEHVSGTAATNNNPSKVPSPSLSTVPSLDFGKGLEGLNHSPHHHNHNNRRRQHQDFGHGVGDSWGHFNHASGGAARAQISRASEYSMSYDGMSGESFASGKGGSVRRRRPGIPHSTICTICSNYVYLFRTRCLVCGRVYCRQCVEIGMGEMTEGRKCIECLGLRFSQRYIERAGMVGCCSWRYPSTLKHAELTWAEKGPRRSGDRGYGHHSMASSRPRRTPLSIASTEPSLVMSATHSPFSAHYNLPL
ncbi:hypothetical protein PHAVU_006G078700 [Phaseolus vulgaris]|uniref:FYVE-type domain-containing protein n=1 Tax=Phaseolus vulgaris TaxID=3885 RepID=V7BLM0_PHAVU|nr:hypothetical protein PHAVU_006G078700g [Phaseolus vulgaris]ESW18879.1 hypothetical protein PHAVU_006G078700g [Phaseolus vulgaris]